MTTTPRLRAHPALILPERPHLDHLRHEAKRRHAVLKAASQNARLSDAQFLLARDYGFSSWPSLKAEVDRRRALCGVVERPVPMVLPRRERRRTRIAAMVGPSVAEQALYFAAAASFAWTQLREIGGAIPTLLHLLLR